MAWDKGDWLNLAGAFARDDQLDKAEKIKERGEQLAELNKLYMTIATQKYATDEALYRENQKAWLDRDRKLRAIGPSSSKTNIAETLASLDGKTWTDEDEKEAIISTYMNNIIPIKYTDEDDIPEGKKVGDVKQWKLSSDYNPSPIAPQWGKEYYDMEMYPQKIDELKDSTRGKWTTFLRGKNWDSGEEVLASLQTNLEEGSKRSNKEFSDYYNAGQEYSWDATDDDDDSIIDSELLSSASIEDEFNTYFNMLPVDKTQQKEWLEDGEPNNNWSVTQTMVNDFITKNLSETAQNELALDILKTLPDSEDKYWTTVEGGETTFAPGAETTKALILAGYKDFIMGEALAAISPISGGIYDEGSNQVIFGDPRPFSTYDRNKKLATWLNDNKVELSNLAYPGFKGGSVNAIYVIPSPVKGNNNPLVLQKIRGELIDLVNISPAKDSTLQETIRAEFNKNGIPMPQARELATDSSFQAWIPYLDAWANHRLESFKTANIPSVAITNEKIAEFDMPPIFSGMQSLTEILSLDDITKGNVGLLVEENSIRKFHSWDNIHLNLQDAKEQSEEAHQAMLDLYFSDKRGEGFNNDANSSFLNSYPLIVDYFKLGTTTDDAGDNTASGAPEKGEIVSARPSYVRVEGDKVVVKADGIEKLYSPGDTIIQKINNLPIYKIYTVNSISSNTYGQTGSLSVGKKLDTINELNDNNLLTDEFITLFNEKGINPERKVSYPVTNIQFFKDEPTFNTGIGKQWKFKDLVTTTSGNTYKAETYEYTRPNSGYSETAVRFVLVEEPEAESTKVPTTTDDEFISGIQNAIEPSER